MKKEQEQECTCDKAKSAHDKLNEDILEAVFDSRNDLEPPHVVFVGIHLFASLAYDSCKDKEQAKEYVMGIVEEAFRHEEEITQLEAEEVSNVVH